MSLLFTWVAFCVADIAMAAAYSGGDSLPMSILTSLVEMPSVCSMGFCDLVTSSYAGGGEGALSSLNGGNSSEKKPLIFLKIQTTWILL